MTETTKLPKWFGKPIPKGDAPRRDFYLCTHCGGQSCGGVYSSICHQCDGISSNPPRDSRFEYLCIYCARNRRVCTCDYPRPPTHFIPPTASSSTQTLPSPVCCSSCTWCNYLCKCVCCCLTCLWQTSTCRRCCISNWKCPCCFCSWPWFQCSCSSQPEQ